MGLSDPRINADGTLPMYRDPATGHTLPTPAAESLLSGGGVHDHDDDYAALGHAHAGGDHPDLATHTGLGLSAAHGHPYSASDHDHAGVYATPHAHDYAASGHNHDAVYATAGHSHGGQGGERFKVGDLYVTTVNYADGAAVAAAEGYGTWERAGVGRFLLLTDANAGTEAGSATHSHGFSQPSDHGALTHSGSAVGNHSFTQPNAHTDVPTHTHTTDSQGAHVHDEYRNSATTGGLDGWAAGDTSTNTPLLTGYDTGSAGAHTHTAAAPAGAVASQPHTGGAVDAHNVTQPSQHAAQSHSGGSVADGSTEPLSYSAYAWRRTT